MALYEKRFKVAFKQGDGIEIIVDKETGVNYLLVDRVTKMGLTPLLNPDGGPIITKD